MRSLLNKILSTALSASIFLSPISAFSQCQPPSYYRGGCGSCASSGCDPNWILLGAAAVIGGIAGYLGGHNKGERGNSFQFISLNQTFSVVFTPAVPGAGATAAFQPFVVGPDGTITTGTPFTLGGTQVQINIGPPILVGLYVIGVERTDAGGGAISPNPCVTIQAIQSGFINGPPFGIGEFFVPNSITPGNYYSQELSVFNQNT